MKNRNRVEIIVGPDPQPHPPQDLPRRLAVGQEIQLNLNDFRRCDQCGRSAARQRIPSHAFSVVNLESGVKHIGETDGRTLCGKDATSQVWWWRL